MLNQLLESGDDEKQAGIEREVTILFADIRSFTRLSEGLEAHDVVGLLNEIFQLISDRSSSAAARSTSSSATR